MQKKVVVIMGASAGVGRAICRIFALEKTGLALIARDKTGSLPPQMNAKKWALK